MTAPRERPIIFSGDMVRAILDGRKTQTRRLITSATSSMGSHRLSDVDMSRAFREPGNVVFCGHDYLHAPQVSEPDEGFWHRIYSRTEPGDRLWVRETHAFDHLNYLPGSGPVPKAWPPDLDSIDVYYRADGECCEQVPECQWPLPPLGAWRPSIHMPRWAARIFLRVTDVRAERLRDISEEDARAEGVDPPPQQPARGAFADLWDSIYAKRAPWRDDPWVWVVDFEREADFPADDFGDDEIPF